METYAIVVVGYNRINSLKRLLSRLERANYENDNVTLIISLDFDPNDELRKYARQFAWKHGEKILHFYEFKQGLRNHIIQCGNYLNKYHFDAIAVFEDDIFPSGEYYHYMKEAVQFYKDKSQIAGISLYSFSTNPFLYRPFYPALNGFDTYLMQFPCSWGQIWTYDQWNHFYTWYKKNNNIPIQSNNIPKSISSWPETSWLKYFARYCVEKNKYFVYPYISLSTNFNEIGTHVKEENDCFQVVLQEEMKQKYNFCDLNSKVKYDIFFERIDLGKFLKIDEEELCVDLYGDVNRIVDKRYWLTSTISNFKKVAEFGSNMKPHEQNVIYKIAGNNIYLYDTNFQDNNLSNNKKKLILYGCGELGKAWLECLGKENVFCFGDTYKSGLIINGKKVLNLEELKKVKGELKIYISTQYELKKEIYKLLKDAGLSNYVVGTPYINKEINADCNSEIDLETEFEGRNAVLKETHLFQCKLGYASYVSFNTILEKTLIGRYSCIGPDVRIVRGQHPTRNFVSIHPIFYSTQQIINKSYVKENIFEEFRYTKRGYVVEIGNDVWIGNGVRLMEGIHIADGTIVACGANVVKDTEPYSIVAGNPARFIRYRFNEEDVKFLLKLQWWNRRESWIDEHAQYFDNILTLQEKIIEEQEYEK